MISERAMANFLRSGRIAMAAATVFWAAASTSLAVQYKFLTVTGNNVGGNGAFSQFSSLNGNGTIDVTHFFPTNGQGGADNINSAIYPSTFNILFPGTGPVDAHLLQTVYNHKSVVTFDLQNYKITKRTVFGIWNCTDEVPVLQPAPAVYNVQLVNPNLVEVDPSMLNLIGNQDNQTQVQARHQLVMNLSTGDITAGAPLGGTTHMDAAFWDRIPGGTKFIKFYGDLPPLNLIGDGVGFYFADVPEPWSIAMLAIGLWSLCACCRRNR
jgi:hypothetical protein